MPQDRNTRVYHGAHREQRSAPAGRGRQRGPRARHRLALRHTHLHHSQAGRAGAGRLGPAALAARHHRPQPHRRPYPGARPRPTFLDD